MSNLDNNRNTDTIVYDVGTDSMPTLNNDYVLYNSFSAGYPVGVRIHITGNIERIEFMHDEEGNIGSTYVGNIVFNLYLDSNLIRTYSLSDTDSRFYTAVGVSSTLTNPCTHHYVIHDNITVGRDQILEITANFNGIVGYTGGAEVMARIYHR